MNFPSPYGNRVFWTATSAVNAYPGGIGYANRTQGVGSWADILNPVTSNLAALAQQLMTSATIKAKAAIGYKVIEAVVIDGKGYVKMANPQGLLVLVDTNGIETPFTPDQQIREQKIDSGTGRFLPIAAGAGAALLIGGVLLYLALRRR